MGTRVGTGRRKKGGGGELDMVIIGANCFFISQKW